MRIALGLVALLAAQTTLAEGRLAKINPDFPRIANFYGAGVGWKDLSDEEIKKMARYDLIVGGCIDVHYTWDKTFGPGKRRLKDNIPICEKNIARIRAANPHFLALPYIVIIEAVTENNVVPDEFWLRDTKGNLIPNWPGCCRVDLTNRKVTDYVLWLARDELLSHDCFDGIFYDCFSTKVSGTNDGDLDTDRDGKRDDPKALDAAWRDANMRILRETSQMRGGEAMVMINQWTIADFGYDVLNGCMGEDQVVRVARQEISFDKMMADYLAWFGKGRKPVVTSFATTAMMGWIDPYTWRDLPKEEKAKRIAEGQKDERMMRFGLTTTLMGDGYHAFDAGNAGRGQHWWYKEYDAPLGYPKGPCKKHDDGTWRREYDGGLVVCNPGIYDVEVALGRRMKDVTSDLVVDKFPIPATDGRIFLPTEAPLSPAEGLPKPFLPVIAEKIEIAAAAGGRVLRSPAGLDVWLNGSNSVSGLTLKSRRIARGGSPGIYAQHWRGFERENLTTTPETTDRSVALTTKGTLAQGDQKIAFTERIELAPDNHLTLTFDAEALTDLDLRMWRHFIGLPVEVFANAAAKTAQASVVLPEAAQQGAYLSNAQECEFLGKKVRLRVVSSHPMSLVDHRSSGPDEYLLAHYPVLKGGAKAGQKVSAKMELWAQPAD